MPFGFIGDVVEEIGDIILPRGTRGETIGGAFGLPQTGKVISQALSQASGKSAASSPTASQSPQYAPETGLSSVGTGPINQQDYYNMQRGRQIIQGGMVPRLPSPTTPRPTTRTTGADLMDLIPDISITKFFGDSSMACGMSQKKLVTVKQDGCVTVSRRQQNVLRKMLQYMPISEVAYQAGVDTQTMAYLVSKQFPPRRKGISASQLRNAKRVNNQILNMANKLGYDCKPMTTARRGCK